ncbi:probable bifunctional methylthioribulose-1-phosphate dehydratase/enolase-phosphatase E1 [Selaginella moellendorffii]|uniref:probable bifunctional methylthioribulose-1-phosphate dehydratase/enolase-phosphatase E1 n=1 Tax=Selaginella moellendorffii TaxID=88036 RepID=UPI000D1CA210|nr:probable bifunctional methylthioribulose-1-phosphate dehydratase/enolase-phosphatase E1 [Selaginella moellendorffii]|eukprot:XP_024534022.1 probable bifunctional methylthioribulose-1-phosphate dehydratase/enolase-phosphatase E1 [Selaginella moellendorffii]
MAGVIWSSTHQFLMPTIKVSRKRIRVKARSIAAKSQPAVVVLDIEGTTTPISFVSDVLFPYAYNNVHKHLVSTFDSPETQRDIQLLRDQVMQDLAEQGSSPGATPIPPENVSSKEDVIDAVVANVKCMIDADRKVPALKELQGHIWRTGFTTGELKGQVFDDVPLALEQWQQSGTKTYIYSSGSREAQRMIFASTQHGDLRRFLCGFFDTSIGHKRDPQSYKEIFQFVGVDDPSLVTFATDVLEEAQAAKEAGLQAVILLRPGNKPLPADHTDFRTISSLASL